MDAVGSVPQPHLLHACKIDTGLCVAKYICIFKVDIMADKIG